MGDQPSYRAYAVEDVSKEDAKKGVKATWTEIGAAWPHRDGKGYRIHLRALPINNHIELREIAERPDDRDQAQQQSTLAPR